MAVLSAEQQREQANSGTDEVPEALRFDTGALELWMKVNVPGYEGPLEVRKFKGGQSNPTYQLITPTQSYVLRRKPPGKLLPSAHAVDREHRVISALGPTGYPVPECYGLCTDDAVIGTWFYVMENVAGRVFWDQSLPGCDPAERHAIFRAKIETLARLHNIDLARIGLETFGKPGNYMARQVDRWTRQYKASETQDIPEMDRLIEWLPGSLPAQERTSIVHGDYRLDNMIIHPIKPEVAAVLDWELSTLGEPLADFAYLMMNWVYGPLSQIGDLKAHGVPTLEQSVDYYCELTGRSAAPDLDWFFAYSAFRAAAIGQGIAGRMREGTANHPHAGDRAALVVERARKGWEFAQRSWAG